MKKTLAYTIRSKPSDTPAAKLKHPTVGPAVRPAVPKKQGKTPKIKLNTSPVPVLPILTEDLQERPFFHEKSPFYKETSSYYEDKQDDSGDAISGDGLSEAPFEENLHIEPVRTSHSFRRKGPGPHTFRHSFVVGGAILIGLLFGYVVMHTFAQNPQPPAVKSMDASAGSVQPSAAEKPPDSARSAPAQPNGQPSSGQTGATMTLTLPAIPVYLIQGGVFATDESAGKMAEQFKQKGWAVSSSQENGKRYLFLGVGSTHDEADALAGQFRSANQDVYIKEKALQAQTVTLQVSGDKKIGPLPALGQTEADIIHQLSTCTVSGLTTGKTDPTAIQKIVSAHHQLLQQGQEIQSVLKDSPRQLLQKELNDITSAVTGVTQYGKQPDKAYLWQAQENIMHFLADHQQLAASIAN
ncbi:SPOR domain-containing protein [Aneurinibacillus terranovensis]|uniref:SPOR domain-containing protein n=1 Tax=Aneurinibacillus terranovensis TaxID=278991 RepID=UPI000403AFFE|nr:SPOR domain-containing protein [Aneurinibacillus terranovensis]